MPKTETKTDDQTDDQQIPGQMTVDDALAAANGNGKEPLTKAQRGSLLNAAYTKAGARLREAHREEFDGYLREEYEQRGVAHRRRLSKEEREAQEAAAKREKAAKALEAILAEFPDLANLASPDVQTEEVSA